MDLPTLGPRWREAVAALSTGKFPSLPWRGLLRTTLFHSVKIEFLSSPIISVSACRHRRSVPTLAQRIIYPQYRLPSSSQPRCFPHEQCFAAQLLRARGVLRKRIPREFRRGSCRWRRQSSRLWRRRHLIVRREPARGRRWLPDARHTVGQAVIISTGTKNLQEQLFYKDIPFLEQALSRTAKKTERLLYEGTPFSLQKKLYDLTDQPVLSGPGD